MKNNKYYPSIEEEDLVSLPHGFVGASNGEHWCIWECIADFRRGYFPYESEWVRKNGVATSKEIYTEKEAIGFANRCHKSLVAKYGKNYNEI